MIFHKYSSMTKIAKTVTFSIHSVELPHTQRPSIDDDEEEKNDVIKSLSSPIQS